MAKFNEDPDLSRFVNDWQSRDPTERPANLIRTINAVQQWDDQPSDAHKFLQYSAAKGAGELMDLLRHRHKEWAPSTEEYVLGYSPTTLDLIPEADRKRLTDWYGCLGEAFALAGFPEEEKFNEQHGKDFHDRFRLLLERAVAIMANVERSWARVAKAGPTPGR